MTNIVLYILLALFAVGGYVLAYYQWRMKRRRIDAVMDDAIREVANIKRDFELVQRDKRATLSQIAMRHQDVDKLIAKLKAINNPTISVGDAMRILHDERD